MTMRNPFPGMNPFFEQRWPDAHSSLITYLRDALQEPLPDDLIVGAEEEEIERGLEIRDGTGRLITVLELPSPAG